MKTKHIVMFSGGKDSTCMLIEMLRRGMCVDEILFSDIGAEWPQMYDHIKAVEQYIGRPITRITPLRSDFFYWFKDRVIAKGKNIGSVGYGWCGKCKWGTALKRNISNPYVNAIKKEFHVKEYIGINADERSRTQKKHVTANKKFPLYEWGITGKDALRYCYNIGFTWGGLYEKLDRVSCWCCENKNEKELRNMFNSYPKVWTNLEGLQRQTKYLYKGRGVDWYTKKFTEENRQMTLF